MRDDKYCIMLVEKNKMQSLNTHNIKTLFIRYIKINHCNHKTILGGPRSTGKVIVLAM